jgi:hypothetical protein
MPVLRSLLAVGALIILCISWCVRPAVKLQEQSTAARDGVSSCNVATLHIQTASIDPLDNLARGSKAHQ